MKFSTRTRYGLRMMVELARCLQKQDLVQLSRIAKITGLSVNYLAQLAIPLRSSGLLIGVSGKHGGYQLARRPEEIRVADIIRAVQGPVNLTDCVSSPSICLNSPFCEARMVWVIAGHKMMEVFEGLSLADLIDKNWRRKTLEEYGDIPLLNPDGFISEADRRAECPATSTE